MDKLNSKPSKKALTPHLIQKGEAPPCIRRGPQCRGCFGWQNMIQAAEQDPNWRKYPLCCTITGLTIAY